MPEYYLFRGKLRETHSGTRAIHDDISHTGEDGRNASSRRILFGKYTININNKIVRLEFHPIDGVRFLRNVGTYILKRTHDVIFQNNISIS
jgi:hypothetical protein